VKHENIKLINFYNKFKHILTLSAAISLPFRCLKLYIMKNYCFHIDKPFELLRQIFLKNITGESFMCLRRTFVGIVSLLVCLLILGMNFQDAAAQEELTNETCLACHGDPGQTHELPSGELLYISVDQETYANSIHGQAEISCVQCHTDIQGYPHPPYQANTRREYTIEQAPICQTCHTHPYEEATNDAHQLAIERGVYEAAVCADCHGAHDITHPAQPLSRIAQTCQRCHSLIYEEYRTSVHGEAMMATNNPDVPTCSDCHNHHNVQGPNNTAFTLFSPELCARCHANRELANRYGMNPYVYDTYLADFHGTTITIFQAVAPGQRPNQAVCIDCHGFHQILRVDDPESVRENILPTCQRCHPQATIDFPASWLSHYPPSPTRSPLTFYARLFYTILIPVIIGGMALFIVGDVGRRISNRRSEPND
jgi:predicted CXXCH cytochrome family protein